MWSGMASLLEFSIWSISWKKSNSDNSSPAMQTYMNKTCKKSTLGIFIMQKMSHHTSSHQEILAFLWWNTLISVIIILNETLWCPTAIVLQTPSFRICPSLGNQLANQPINQSKSTSQPTTQHHFLSCCCWFCSIWSLADGPVGPNGTGNPKPNPPKPKGEYPKGEKPKGEITSVSWMGENGTLHFFELPVRNLFFF